MGKHDQRMRGGGFGHELITRSPHCFGIAARIHPVRVLHLTGIMEQVAEIVETLARGADTDDRMARRLTRAGYHADTWHDLALAVDHLKQVELLNGSKCACHCRIHVSLTAIPVARSNHVSCVRKACDALTSTHCCHTIKVIRMGMGDQHMRDGVRMYAALRKSCVKARRKRE